MRFKEILNPYLVHFGNIQERHLWKKNPKFTFWSLMTSYMVEYLWRHINLKLHQLGYLYVTWPKSRDVISVRYHVMKLITPKNPGNELASFLEKKSRRVWKTHSTLQRQKKMPQKILYLENILSKTQFFRKTFWWWYHINLYLDVKDKKYRKKTYA